MTKRETILFIFVFALGAFLRFSNLTHTSLWMDEIWSIEIASGRGHQHDQLPNATIRQDQIDLTTLNGAPAWWHVWSADSDFTYPPLYPLILRLWMNCFGNSAAAVRSLSAVFSLATVFVFFDLLRLFHGTRIALTGAAIIALAGAQIDAAQEARCYALLVLLAVACADLLARIELRGPSCRRSIFFGFLLLSALFTHYLMLGVVVAFALYALIRLRGAARRSALIVMVGAVLLFAIIWGHAMLWQSRHLPGPTPSFLRETFPDRHLELTARRIIGLPGEYLLGESVADKIFAQQTPIDELLTICLLALAVLTLIIPWARLRRRPDLILWMLWIAGTIGLVATADLARETTMTGYIRYTILASPAIYAVIAAWNWPNRELFRHGIARAVITGLLILAVYRRHDPPQSKEDWRNAAVQFNTAAQNDDLVVFYNPDPWVAPGIWHVCLYYYAAHQSERQFNHPWLLLRDRPDSNLRDQISTHASLWLVTLNAPTTSGLLFPGWQVEKVIPVSSDVSLCQLAHPR
jgi:hypothetical protein